MRLQDLDILIIGAGVAGLSAAALLAGAGARVRLIEQAPEITEVGAGLQISPNGAAVLREMGLQQALEGSATVAGAVQLRDGPEDRLVARLDLALRGAGMASYLMHRADLIALLAKAATDAGVRPMLGQTVEALTLTPGGPEVRLADGTCLRADLLLGADGLRAHSRQAIDGPSQPFFTGQIAWRALIPCDDAAPDGAAAEVEVHMGEGCHLVSYPLRGGRLRNIVAVEERRRWVDEDWSLRDDPVALRLAFDEFGPRVRSWLEAVDQPWLWGLFRHQVASRWVWSAPDARSGAALLGDAVHPTLPFLAQGANMALEDAFVLRRCLQEGGDLPASLAAYQAARLPRCRRIVQASGRAAGIYHLRDPLRDPVQLAMRVASRIAPGAILGRYDWIHRRDVTRAAAG